jgi:hypothetical protein
VDPRVVLDAVVKRKISSPRRESNPRTSNWENSGFIFIFGFLDRRRKDKEILN